MRRRRLSGILLDLTPLRVYPDLRYLLAGMFGSNLGTQAALVALPYQVYVQTGSPFLTGLLGAVELVPLIAAGLGGGVLSDRVDRRSLLLLAQVAIVVVAAALAAFAFAGDPPLLVIYLLAALLASLNAVQNVVRSALVPALVEPQDLKGALALDFGLLQIAFVVGPAVAGVLIATAGVGSAYVLDAASCLVLVAALLRMSPRPPPPRPAEVGAWRALREGLSFVRRRQELMATLWIDFVATAFGLPRVLFPVLALTVYGSGPAGVGLLYASVSAGATLGAFTTGWLIKARRLGRIVIGAVTVWGVAITVAGLADGLAVAALLFAVAGAADSVSAICRQTITQSITPDRLRGRVSAVFSLAATSGPRTGDVEAGAVAGLAGARASVVSGGIACIVAALLVALLMPALARYDAADWLPERERLS